MRFYTGIIYSIPAWALFALVSIARGADDFRPTVPHDFRNLSERDCRVDVELGNLDLPGDVGNGRSDAAR